MEVKILQTNSVDMRSFITKAGETGGRGHGPSTFFKAKKSFFKDFYHKVRGCPKEERELMPHIVHAITLLLVNSATSCTPERSFSTARRLKSWLKGTMKSSRYNSLTILNIHKDVTDRLDLKAIRNEVVSTRE